jgi:Flp pilus assembly pilin Flp
MLQKIRKGFIRDSRGQTPTEYLMIVGLMAVVIITVFVIFYWNSVRGNAKNWVKNVQQSVEGKNIQP